VTFKNVDVRLPATVRAAGLARRALFDLRPLIPEPRYDELELLVSELVANSVRHSSDLGDRGWIHLKAFASGDLVRVEVRDPGPGFNPDPRCPHPEETTGRGIFLLDQIADRWGVQTNDDTCVWFILAA
jgi:anti-sigma regulatory factor (Ser/Thr protein kinase)